MIDVYVLGNTRTDEWLKRQRKTLLPSGFDCHFMSTESEQTGLKSPDLWLFDADGFDAPQLQMAMEQIENWPNVDKAPMVVIGHVISIELANQAVSNGARRFLRKPVTTRMLCTTCSELGLTESPSGRAVIVIDDRDQMHETVHKHLARKSIHSFRASNLQASLELLEQHEPDAIVVGQRGTSADQQQLADLLSFLPESSNLPVIFISEPDAPTGDRQNRGYKPKGYHADLAHLAQAILELSHYHGRRKTPGGRIYDILYEREQEHFALNQHAIVSKTDSTGQIIEVNRRFCDISQYSEAELLGQNHRVVKSGHHAPDFYKELWQTICRGDVWQGELCNLAKDGTTYWVSSTIVPFLDNKKRPYQFIAIRKDITHVKTAENRIALQGKLSRLVSEASAQAMAGQWSAAPETLQAALQPLCDFLAIRHISVHLHSANPVPAAWKTFFSDPKTACSIAIGDTATDDAVAQDGECPAFATVLKADEKELGRLQFYAPPTPLIEIFREQGLVDVLGNVVSHSLARWISEFHQELSRERLRKAQSFANIGTWEWNLETDEVFWTERVPLLFGYPEGNLETCFQHFFDALHPEDRDKVQLAIQASIEHDLPYQIEHRVIWPDGTVRWLLETGAVVRATDGTAKQMMGVVEDISAMHETRLQLARQTALLNMLHDSLTAFILEGKFRATLDSMLKSLIDLTDSEFGFLAEVLFTPGDAPFLRVQSITDISWGHESAGMYSRVGTENFEFHNLDNMLGEAIRRREIVTVSAAQSEGRFTGLPNGHPNIRTLLSVPVFIGSELVGNVALANRRSGYDASIIEFLRPFMATYGVIINSQRMLDMEDVNRRSLVRAKLRADQANRAKSEFLSSMSHELRTPLNAIQGFGQLLQSDPTLNDDQQDSIGEVLSASKHLLTLINEVLDLARIESGKLELSLESVPVSSVVHDALTLIKHAAEKRGLAIETHGIEHVHVFADWTRLKQAVLNLLSNAVKYNRLNGSIQIEARLYQVSWIDIRISDTGNGIQESRFPDLFQPFNRLGAELGHIEGTGIGLSLTRQLVELMGGSIGVTSAVGKGSTFWIRLPADSRDTCTSGLPALHSSSSPDNSADKLRAGKRTILYIEDNPANLKLVARIIKRQPRYTLISAASAADGLRLASNYPPDLVLVDINLPDMNGYLLLDKLKAVEHLNQKPMLALTANAMNDDMQRGRNAGFDDYLTKPINIDELMNTLEKYLG